MENKKAAAPELETSAESDPGMELEIKRLIVCYKHASMDDKKVVWAALNKYARYADELLIDGKL